MNALAEIVSTSDPFDFVCRSARTLGYRVHLDGVRRVRNGRRRHGGYVRTYPRIALTLPRIDDRPTTVLFVDVVRDDLDEPLSPTERDFVEALIASGARWQLVHVPSELADFVTTLADLAATR